jgi:AraC-like DNA-binding protein
MAEMPSHLRYIHTHGPETREWLISYGDHALLDLRGIDAVGWTDAGAGHVMANPAPKRALLHATLEGEGEVLVDGAWRPAPAETAYLTPIGCPHAYRTRPGRRWLACWVLTRDDALLGGTDRAVLCRTDSAEVLHWAIQGLHQEGHGAADPAALERWLELVLVYARRIGGGREPDGGRLGTLWRRVFADLAHPWTLADLAATAGLSDETLRRVCKRETGCSPMEYVTHLRMRHAASLLVTYSHPVAEIAERVGYADPFAFSTAFRRVLGVPPTAYRRREGALPDGPQRPK